MISAIIVTACFILVIVLILTDKMNRAMAALSGTTITLFTLTLINVIHFLTYV